MDWITLIIVIVASLGIGYFSAVLIGNIRREEPPDVIVPNADKPVEIDNEVFRLLKNKDGNGVITEIHGRKVVTAIELNPEEHAEISMGLVDLYAWLERSNRPALSKKAMENAIEVSKEIQAGDLPSSAVGLSAVPVQNLPKSTGLNIFKSLRRTTQKEIEEKIAKPPETIASQVDEILQRKLEEREVDDKAVRLLDLEGQGMVIMVGLEKYSDLEDVPDEELRGILRESVSEWESVMLRGS